MEIIKIKEIIAPHFWDTFNSKQTNQIYKGGRSSTKSSMISINSIQLFKESKLFSSHIKKTSKSTKKVRL